MTREPGSTAVGRLVLLLLVAAACSSPPASPPPVAGPDGSVADCLADVRLLLHLSPPSEDQLPAIPERPPARWDPRLHTAQFDVHRSLVAIVRALPDQMPPMDEAGDIDSWVATMSGPIRNACENVGFDPAGTYVNTHKGDLWGRGPADVGFDPTLTDIPPADLPRCVTRAAAAAVDDLVEALSSTTGTTLPASTSGMQRLAVVDDPVSDPAMQAYAAAMAAAFPLLPAYLDGDLDGPITPHDVAYDRARESCDATYRDRGQAAGGGPDQTWPGAGPVALAARLTADGDSPPGWAHSPQTVAVHVAAALADRDLDSVRWLLAGDMVTNPPAAPTGAVQAVEVTGCVELPEGRASCTVTFDPDGSQLGLAVYFDQINGVWTANGTAPID